MEVAIAQAFKILLRSQKRVFRITVDIKKLKIYAEPYATALSADPSFVDTISVSYNTNSLMQADVFHSVDVIKEFDDDNELFVADGFCSVRFDEKMNWSDFLRLFIRDQNSFLPIFVRAGPVDLSNLSKDVETDISNSKIEKIRNPMNGKPVAETVGVANLSFNDLFTKDVFSMTSQPEGFSLALQEYKNNKNNKNNNKGHWDVPCFERMLCIDLMSKYSTVPTIAGGVYLGVAIDAILNEEESNSYFLSLNSVGINLKSSIFKLQTSRLTDSEIQNNNSNKSFNTPNPSVSQVSPHGQIVSGCSLPLEKYDSNCFSPLTSLSEPFPPRVSLDTVQLSDMEIRKKTDQWDRLFSILQKNELELKMDKKEFELLKIVRTETLWELKEENKQLKEDKKKIEDRLEELDRQIKTLVMNKNNENNYKNNSDDDKKINNFKNYDKWTTTGVQIGSTTLRSENLKKNENDKIEIKIESDDLSLIEKLKKQNEKLIRLLYLQHKMITETNSKDLNSEIEIKTNPVSSYQRWLSAMPQIDEMKKNNNYSFNLKNNNNENNKTFPLFSLSDYHPLNSNSQKNKNDFLFSKIQFGNQVEHNIKPKIPNTMPLPFGRSLKDGSVFFRDPKGVLNKSSSDLIIDSSKMKKSFCDTYDDVGIIKNKNKIFCEEDNYRNYYLKKDTNINQPQKQSHKNEFQKRRRDIPSLRSSKENKNNNNNKNAKNKNEIRLVMSSQLHSEKKKKL